MVPCMESPRAVMTWIRERLPPSFSRAHSLSTWTKSTTSTASLLMYPSPSAATTSSRSKRTRSSARPSERFSDDPSPVFSHSTDTFSASAISKRYFGCRTCPSRIFAIAGRDTPTAIAKELAFIPLVSITVLILLPKVSMFTPRK